MKLFQDSRDLHYFEKFGSTDTFPASFSVKDRIPEPVQPIGNEQCTCYATTYMAGEQDGVVYDVDYLWSMIPHTDSGADPREALGEATKGLRRKDTGEMVFHWSSYFRADTYGSGTDAFDATRSAMMLSNSVVGIATPWYLEWRNKTILSLGKNIATYHMYCATGWEEINGEPMLIIEAWTGIKLYMNRETFNAAIKSIGSGAWVLSTLEIDKIRKISLLQKLIDLMTNLYIELTSMKKENMIVKWANAIKVWEGNAPYLNNPGSLKVSGLTKSWGAQNGIQASDGGWIARFATYDQGFTALCNFLTMGCMNELLAFHSPEARTFQGFTKIYAGNPPASYIEGIRRLLGCEMDTQISTFLN